MTLIFGTASILGEQIGFLRVEISSLSKLVPEIVRLSPVGIYF